MVLYNKFYRFNQFSHWKNNSFIKKKYFLSPNNSFRFRMYEKHRCVFVQQGYRKEGPRTSSVTVNLPPGTCDQKEICKQQQQREIGQTMHFYMPSNYRTKKNHRTIRNIQKINVLIFRSHRNLRHHVLRQNYIRQVRIKK